MDESYKQWGLADTLEFYQEIIAANDVETLRHMCLTDRYFLLVSVLGMTYMVNEWAFQRCREVEADPDGYLDLWARGHYKSTIITVGGIIQEVLRDPNLTVCVLSYNGPTARKFIGQIKQAFEHPALTALFPDILYAKPPNERWSLQGGLFVKRTTLSKEPSVMGSGLVDGMPTGMHFGLRVYDDVVTRESVFTPEQIEKTTEAFELSDALGTGDGQRMWMVGTRYHPQDTYAEVLKRGTAVERRRPCVDADGTPLLLTRETLADKRITMGPQVFAAQMMLEPSSAETATFQREWKQVYENPPALSTMNIWIIVDPASGKEKRGKRGADLDYTVMEVVGLGEDNNYYTLPGSLRDRLNLTQRTAALFRLVRQYPNSKVAYEEYGLQADVEHIQSVQEETHYRFAIIKVGGSMPKPQRIERLVPLFEAGRWWHQRRLPFVRRDGTVGDFTHEFFEDEFNTFPVVAHDDMLDAKARIFDVPAVFPRPRPQVTAATQSPRTNNTYDPLARR